MTDRLYYADPYLREFDATIERVESRDGRTAVTLDRTAFYPTSGGQPFDTGALGDHRIADVVDDEDGTIMHVLEASDARPAAGLQAGQRVRGVVDWARRFDHMQQHTGQHVLSAAFERLFHIRTVSFHMGAEASTIDLAREATPAEIAAAEDNANRVVWEDRPVAIRYASAEEAAKMPLRKEPVRGGTLRLIDVADFDLSACGGTHVARTGAIGVIVVSRWERFKGGQRVEFLCGGRALRAYRLLRDAATASVRLLSVLPEELPGAIERLQGDAKDQKRQVAAQQLELARYRADELAADAEPVPGGRLVVRAVDADSSSLKAMAATIAARPGFIVALFSSSAPTLAVVARSSDVDVSAQQILGALIARFGGRGGGRPEMAQGGGLIGVISDIVEAARGIAAPHS